MCQNLYFISYIELPDDMLEGGCDIVPVADNVRPGANVWQAIGGTLDT